MAPVNRLAGIARAIAAYGDVTNAPLRRFVELFYRGDHVQASWFAEGKKTGQIALHAGGDDFGGTLIEENVLRLANHHNTTTTGECVALIREAGFRPVQRTTLYEHVREW